MKHLLYLKLAQSKKVNPTGDPEGQTLDAPVLKILKYVGLDETQEKSQIAFIYTYGFVNSRGVFRAYDSLVYREVIIDIEPIMKDGAAQKNGINEISRQEEPAGDWLTAITTIAGDQPNRLSGDFRLIDLYHHLQKKYGFAGDIVNV